MNIVWIGVASFAGTLAGSVFGWLTSGEKFEVRKFMASIIRGIVIAAGIAVTFEVTGQARARDLLLAFGSGAGGDALIKSAGGYIIGLTK